MEEALELYGEQVQVLRVFTKDRMEGRDWLAPAFSSAFLKFVTYLVPSVCPLNPASVTLMMPSNSP